VQRLYELSGDGNVELAALDRLTQIKAELTRLKTLPPTYASFTLDREYGNKAEGIIRERLDKLEGLKGKNDTYQSLEPY
jgi:hypothetical protein